MSWPVARPHRPVRQLTSAVALLLTAALVAACSSSSGANDNGAVRRQPAQTAGTTPGGSTVPRPASDKLAVTLKLNEVGKATSPVAMTARPNSSTLYIAEQAGQIRTLHVQPDGAGGTVDPCCLLDIHEEVSGAGERGLLGLAFSPDGNTLYAYFTDTSGRIRVVSYRMNGETLDTGSRVELLNLQHDRPNHNGGQLQLGPDGFLYLGVGDGGGGGDPDRNGQNPSTLYGKLLRIDPSKPAGGKQYGIPTGNPYADGNGGAPEVWLYGARNPWRFSFDRVTGDLWVGDVGQNEIEEIDFLPSSGVGTAGKGVNLGWPLMEGSRPYNGGTPPPNHTGPIFEYNHDNNECSVISGYVYRGTSIPALVGVLPYADYCIGELRGLLIDGGRLLDEGPLGAKVQLITSFGQDNEGELYALSQKGSIYRLAAG